MDLSQIRSYDWNNVLSPWIGMDLSCWDILTRGRTPRHYIKNEVIFSHGSNYDNAYLVASGRVRMSITSSDGQEKHLYIACPGSIIGEASCILSVPHITTATTIVPSDIYKIPSKELQQTFHGNAQFADLFLQYEARKNYMQIAQQASLSFSSAQARVAMTFLCLSDMHGIKTSGGTKIDIKVTCDDIAGIISTSRVTTNTILMDFRAQGILEKEEGRYIIADEALLQEVAESHFDYISHSSL